MASDLEQKLFAANKRRYSSAASPLKSHGPDHHWRVYQYALSLADKLHATYDPDILAGAALLHDMAAYYPDKIGEDYHSFDHHIAADVLREIDFPNEKIEAVMYAIAHHGSDPTYKDRIESIEVTLLRDADKLDVFGPVGVARIVMVRALKGDTLQDIVPIFIRAAICSANGNQSPPTRRVNLPALIMNIHATFLSDSPTVFRIKAGTK